MEESVEDPSGVTAGSNWFEPVGAGYGGGTTGRNRTFRPPTRKEERTRVHHHDSDHHHPRAARAVPDQASRLEPRASGTGDVRGEGLEGGHVPVDVLLLVGDREGPLLLDARRHEDAVVPVVEPGERVQLAVDLGEVVAVLVDRLGREDHATLRTEPLRVRRQAVALDDLLAAGLERVVRLLELVV